MILHRTISAADLDAIERKWNGPWDGTDSFADLLAIARELLKRLDLIENTKRQQTDPLVVQADGYLTKQKAPKWKVENYNLCRLDGSHIRVATKVIYDDGTEIKFVERLSKRRAIAEATFHFGLRGLPFGNINARKQWRS